MAPGKDVNGIDTKEGGGGTRWQAISVDQSKGKSTLLMRRLWRAL